MALFSSLLLAICLYLPDPGRSVSLHWIASTSAGVVGYNIYRADTNGDPGEALAWNKITVAPIDTVTYEDLAVSSLKVYFYRLTAVDGAGVESEFSNQATAIMNPNLVSGASSLGGNGSIH